MKIHPASLEFEAPSDACLIDEYVLFYKTGEREFLCGRVACTVSRKSLGWCYGIDVITSDGHLEYYIRPINEVCPIREESINVG